MCEAGRGGGGIRHIIKCTRYIQEVLRTRDIRQVVTEMYVYVCSMCRHPEGLERTRSKGQS